MLAALALCARADDFQGATHMTPFEEDTINYNKAAVTGTVTRLQKRIDAGEVTLQHNEAYGYLLAVLDELKVPKSSQMLVFSKTSLQREHISPSNPRAIFFNDDVYVGYIPGAPANSVGVNLPSATDSENFVWDSTLWQPRPTLLQNLRSKLFYSAP